MSGFVLSPAAQADIEAIWNYSVERWGAARAEAYVLEIRNACRGLVAGAKASRPADEIRAGYRKALVGSRILFFRRTDAGLIDIVRILHQRMDPTRHIDAWRLHSDRRDTASCRAGRMNQMQYVFSGVKPLKPTEA